MTEETDVQPPSGKEEVKRKLEELFALCERVPAPTQSKMRRALQLNTMSILRDGLSDLRECAARSQWPERISATRMKAALPDIMDYVIGPYVGASELRSAAPDPALAEQPAAAAAAEAECARNVVLALSGIGHLPKAKEFVTHFVETLTKSLWVTAAMGALNKEGSRRGGACDQALDNFNATMTPLLNIFPKDVASTLEALALNVYHRVSTADGMSELVAQCSATRIAEEQMIETCKEFCRRKKPEVYEQIVAIEQFVRREFPGAFEPHVFTMSDDHKERLAAQQARADERAEAERRVAEARARSAATAKAAAEEAGKPKPFTLSGPARTILDRLEGFTRNHSLSSRLAGHMAATIRAISGNGEWDAESPAASAALPKIDLKGENMSAFAGMLLEDSNLLGAADALDLKKGLNGVGSSALAQSSASQLSILYRSSAAVKELVDALLQDDMGIVLVGTLARGARRTGKYGAALIKDTNTMESNHQVVATYLSTSGLALEDLQLFEEADLPKAVISARKAEADASAGLARMRAGFVQEIQQSLMGVARKNIRLAEIPDAAEEKMSPPADIPPLLMAKLRVEQERAHPLFSVTQSPKRGQIRICSEEYPEIHVDIKPGASETRINSAVAEVLTEAALMPVNQQKIVELCDQKGFEYDPADSTVLRHKEYGKNGNDAFIIPLTGSQEDLNRALLRAEEECEKNLFKQKSLLRLAQSVGITVNGVDDDCNARGMITLTYGDQNERIAPSGYLSNDNIVVVEALIEKVRQKDRVDAVPLEPEVTTTKKPLTQWQPGDDQTLIVVDASTLHNLAAERLPPSKASAAGDKVYTYLDLLKCTAQLPNVKIIIPAVVADWELQRKVPNKGADLDKESGDFQQVSPERFTGTPSGRNDTIDLLKYKAARVREFLQSASRARIEGDTVMIAENANKNIIIMETAGDEELYDRIRRIVADTPGRPNKRLAEEVDKRNEGEHAANRIISEMPLKLPMVVLSDDLKYLKNDAPKQTGRGMPVGQAGSATYLAAELITRGPYIDQKMDTLTPLYVHKVHDEISAFWQKYQARAWDDVTGEIVEKPQIPFFCERDKAGHDEGPKGKYLSEVIADGFTKLVHRGSANGTGEGTARSGAGAGGWVDQVAGGRRRRPHDAPADNLPSRYNRGESGTLGLI